MLTFVNGVLTTAWRHPDHVAARDCMTSLPSRALAASVLPDAGPR